MSTLILVAVASLTLAVTSCQAGWIDDLSRGGLSLPAQRGSLDDSTIVKGLKEALAVGTERAVTTVAKPNGYFNNQLIRILLPDKLQQAAGLLGRVGYQKQVDELVLSMNRAAEQAAPMAAGFFGDAIRQMTVEDARGILSGGDTAATSFFEKKTRTQLFEAFKPKVAQTMQKVGTVNAYNNLMGNLPSLPIGALSGATSLDINSYVTDKALDGLFKMVGLEEKKIRTNPAAQTTDLLQKVFGGRR